jgi:Flp pilus assembly protein TadG
MNPSNGVYPILSILRQGHEVDTQPLRIKTDSTGFGGSSEPTYKPRSAARCRLAGSWRCDDRGQALVEFALVLPVLMLILLGIVKGGVVFNNYLQLTDATRSGARELAIERGQGSPCFDAAQTLLTSIGSGLNQSQITMTMTEDTAPGITYTWANGMGSNNSGSNPNSVSDCGFNLVAGSAVQLTAQYPCDFNLPYVRPIQVCKLTASATERVE